ncbi:long-chain-fatty-acid--CoA ligase [Streptomyces sp. DSM 44917]|uniref:Long-chain-fatty-acid--CoA ligase n=1 Tax=Streptomyces boetiae TaxID=3075541 RepID=A0ABU2L7Q6_9ACTN|nr:long-chain-fatty-acid--CoA ligase [Streptomyces sp. DSM 44917]MDT0307333.1 long-chain-fatty-acid--CoA ligase [Streptomyces sp. DSM 44917]
MRIDTVLRRAAHTYPHSVATEFEDRSRTWSDLLHRVRRLAGALRGLGVGPGDRVAVLGHNSDRYLEVLYAVPWAGAIVVPVNTRLAAPETDHWLRDSGSRVLLVEQEFRDLAEKLRGGLPGLAHVVGIDVPDAPAGWHDYETLLAGAAALPAAEGPDTDPAAIFYTGGTTGRSKGVTLSHRNLLASALQSLVDLGWSESSVYLHAAPMFHMADGLGTYAALLAAARQTMCRRFDVPRVLAAIEEHGVTCSVMVPTMIDMLVSHPDTGRHDLSTVACLAFGGSPMPEATVRRARGVLPAARLFQLYGQSEASPTLTVLRPEYHVFDGPLAGKTRSAGRPATGCEVAVVGEDGAFLPPGEVGEIVGRGDNVMLGYWQRPELTAETLRGGWLHTGDAGYLDEDGFLFVVDRIKDMIVTGGENVYSAEVENALMLHPEVTEAQVIGIPATEWGEAVHAIVRVRGPRVPTAEEIIAHCRAHIANYKCPKSVEFRDEPFPTSGAGKYVKQQLREQYWAGRERRVN